MRTTLAGGGGAASIPPTTPPMTPPGTPPSTPPGTPPSTPRSRPSSGLIVFGTSIGATKPCGCVTFTLGGALTIARAPAGGGGGGGGGGATSSGVTKNALSAPWLGKEL